MTNAMKISDMAIFRAFPVVMEKFIQPHLLLISPLSSPFTDIVIRKKHIYPFSNRLYKTLQNILRQHMHQKEFWILIIKCGNKLKHENEAEES
jgi:hypothetical protein